MRARRLITDARRPATKEIHAASLPEPLFSRARIKSCEGVRIQVVVQGACGSPRSNIAETARTFHNRRGAGLRIPVPRKASVVASRTHHPRRRSHSQQAIKDSGYLDVEISAVSFVTAGDDLVAITNLELRRKSTRDCEPAHFECVTAVTHGYYFAQPPPTGGFATFMKPGIEVRCSYCITAYGFRPCRTHAVNLFANLWAGCGTAILNSIAHSLAAAASR